MARIGLGEVAYLHGHYSIVYRDLFCEKVCADCCFVACAELLVNLQDGV